jgi:hypothetical protein
VNGKSKKLLTIMKKRVILYSQWYKKLRKQEHKMHNSISWAIYNSAYYDIDGKYKEI